MWRTSITLTASKVKRSVTVSTVRLVGQLNRRYEKLISIFRSRRINGVSKQQTDRRRQLHASSKKWFRKKKDEPTEEALPQGIVVGCNGGKLGTTALVDTGDVHVLMIGAAGVGKTAYWLYPCIEYACASGMSFLSTDTKGDVMRNYGNIAKQYGYHVSVIDLRNPTRSNGNNLLHLVNKYMDLYQKENQLIYLISYLL